MKLFGAIFVLCSLLPASCERQGVSASGTVDSSETAIADLDGDGDPERLELVPGSCGTGGCVYDVLTNRDGAQKRLGRVDGRWSRSEDSSETPSLPNTLRVGSERSHGFLDLFSHWELGCCQRVDLHYRFDGRSYRRFRERECSLDASSEEARFTCQAWSAPTD